MGVSPTETPLTNTCAPSGDELTASEPLNLVDGADVVSVTVAWDRAPAVALGFCRTPSPAVETVFAAGRRATESVLSGCDDALAAIGVERTSIGEGIARNSVCGSIAATSVDGGTAFRSVGEAVALTAFNGGVEYGSEGTSATYAAAAGRAAVKVVQIERSDSLLSGCCVQRNGTIPTATPPTNPAAPQI